ncbi:MULTISPECIES: hypothetical protein [unclassified Curtobacterium]|jgi:DNA-binding Lrp family transcriptional regulator|uniref:DprA-like winged helix domain-containing protein n=1 Tax=unclassified Curtobacterium TaxID=257496 RepID=UPI000F4ADAEE|nr:MULTISPECIES: hypothetical protein [unclassified Curtobacterium]
MTVQSLEVPARVRPGRPFLPIRERELDGTLRTVASRLPGAEAGLLLGPEFAGPIGVVDLLAVTRVSGAFAMRSSLKLPYITTEIEATVVAATYEAKTRTVDRVALDLGMSVASVGRRLRELEVRGVVHRVGGGYRRAPGIQPIGRAYALEAKVSDWRRGLAQALKYSSWCDAAGVVLLEAPSSLEQAKERFRDFGLGLAVREHWLVRPRIGKPLAGRRLALSERLSAALAEAAADQSPSAPA